MDRTEDDNAFKHCFFGDESLLMHAVLESNLDCMKLLIEQGADVNYECYHGMSAILIAIKIGNLECVNMLTQNGADADKVSTVKIDTETEIDITPLMIACELNSTRIAQAVINAGASIHKTMLNGVNALITATDANSDECVELLLQHGANPNTHINTQTPLMAASINSNAKLIRLLIQHGADLNAQDCQGNTALMLAARKKNVECLQVLISKGANLNLKDNDHFHALLIAQCCQDNDASVSLLIRAGSLVNMANVYNETPLCYAIDSDREVIFQQLIASQANVNQLIGDGYSPLWLVINSYEQIDQPERYIQTLLQHGASPNIGNYPPLTAAARYSYLSCVQMLLQGGANINAVDPEFGTALSIAGYTGSIQLLQLAWHHNALINISAIMPGHSPQIVDEDVLLKLYATGQKWSYFESNAPDLPTYLTQEQNEKSLKNYCREAIRKNIVQSGRNIDLFREVRLLPLPKQLQMYLLYNATMP